MSKNLSSLNSYVETLAEDARELLAATSDVAGDQVRDARRRLASALDSGLDIYGKVRDKAAVGVKYADHSVRENPYAPIAVALIVGGILAMLFCRRRD